MDENLPQNQNNFESIISTWRRLSYEPDICNTINFTSMPGDSSGSILKKKEGENLLILDRPKGPIATAASAGVVVVADKPNAGPENENTPKENEESLEKPEFITNSDYYEEAGGDAQFNNDKEDKNFLENDEKTMRFPESEKTRADNVDSVYLRPPPPHKVRSNSSTNDDEGCGLKCLYYTLQCCDCVLM